MLDYRKKSLLFRRFFTWKRRFLNDQWILSWLTLLNLFSLFCFILYKFDSSFSLHIILIFLINWRLRRRWFSLFFIRLFTILIILEIFKIQLFFFLLLFFFIVFFVLFFLTTTAFLVTFVRALSFLFLFPFTYFTLFLIKSLFVFFLFKVKFDVLLFLLLLIITFNFFNILFFIIGWVLIGLMRQTSIILFLVNRTLFWLFI